MKGFLRRLSSKKDKNRDSKYQQSPNSLRWPSVSRKSLPAPAGGINPTFSDFHQHSAQPNQQHLSSTVQHGNAPADIVSLSNGSTNSVVRDHTPLPTAEAHLPASPDKGRNTALTADQRIATANGGKPPSPYRSATKLPSTITATAQEASFSSPRSHHVAPSIYQTYNDFDIMRSGGFELDDNPILSSAPSADWVTADAELSDRTPPRRMTAGEALRARSRPLWEAKSSPKRFTPQPQLRHTLPGRQARSATPLQSSPEGSALSSTDTYTGPPPFPLEAVKGGPLPSQQMATPFAQYATKAMSSALLSEDLDTAMRPSGQMHPRSSKGSMHERQPSGSVKGQALPLGHGGMASGAMTPRSSPRSYAQARRVATPAEQDMSLLHARLADSSATSLHRNSLQMQPQQSQHSAASPRKLESDFSHTTQQPLSANGNSWQPTRGHGKASPSGHDQSGLIGNGHVVANGHVAANGKAPFSMSGSGPASANGNGPFITHENGQSSMHGNGKLSQRSPQHQSHASQQGASSGHIEEAQRQIEQALQTADCQIEALKARVMKKNAQLSDAKLQLEHIREDMQDMALSQRHAPPSLPDTESSEQTELAAAEMQLLRQALDKLQSETQVLDDELARAREQAIFSELERAELSHELETVSAQLQASQASKAELEETISKLLADVQTGKPHKRRSLSVSRQMLNSDSFRSLNSTPLSADLDNDILASHPNISRATSGHTHTLSFGNGSAHYKDVSSLESEVESLRAELEETKRRTQVEVAQAREEALGVMRATGDADAEVRKLLGESAELTSSQQEAEDHLQQSRQAIQDLQAALRNAQAAMATDRLEREQSLNTISQLKQQLHQLETDQHSLLPKHEGARLTQHISDLDRQAVELSASNDELSTDLGRALDVAQRVMEQKQALQEKVKSQEQQLMQWQAEGQRVRELEGFAEEALTALEAQTQENSRLRQQLAAANVHTS